MFDRICRLTPAGIDELVFRLQAPAQHLSPNNVPVATRATEILRWVGGRPADLEALARALERVEQGRGVSTWEVIKILVEEPHHVARKAFGMGVLGGAAVVMASLFLTRVTSIQLEHGDPELGLADPRRAPLIVETPSWGWYDTGIIVSVGSDGGHVASSRNDPDGSPIPLASGRDDCDGGFCVGVPVAPVILPSITLLPNEPQNEPPTLGVRSSLLCALFGELLLAYLGSFAVSRGIRSRSRRVRAEAIRGLRVLRVFVFVAIGATCLLVAIHESMVRF